MRKKSSTAKELSLEESIAAINLSIKSVAPDAVNNEYGNPYATLAAINKLLKPLFEKHGLVATHSQGPTDKFAPQVLKTSIMQLSTGEVLEESCRLYYDDTMQGLAAACTYAKRLNLSNVFDFSADHDDDGNSISGKESEEGETTSTRKRKAQTVKTSKGRTRAAGTSVSPGLKPAQLEKHGAEIAEMDPEQASDYIMRLMENFELSTDDIDFLNSKVVHDGSTE